MQPTNEEIGYQADLNSIGRKTSSRRIKFGSPYISEDADYILDG